jgi:homocysteine S-methyltransferase
MPPAGSLVETISRRAVVLDGGLATDLESAGHDLSDDLWSARLLQDDPAAVRACHVRFLRVGAEVLVTGSYQLSAVGLGSVGRDGRDADRLVRLSVTLAREAAETAAVPAWVAGSVGPYGAVLADGQEYTGEYVDPVPGSGERMSRRELRDFHRPRIHALAEAGADVLAVETIPALLEVEAILEEVRGLGVPAWVSVTATVDSAGTPHTVHGEPLAEVAGLAAEVDEVLAVGVNCCAPAVVRPAVTTVARAGLPAVVYPNSGETWDGGGRRWLGSARWQRATPADWVSAGARLVGGCCRVGPEAISELAAAVRPPSAADPGAAPAQPERPRRPA